jgi:uncharacterized protein YbaR (Trm112 family)
MSEEILSREVLTMLACPVCHGKLAIDNGRVCCEQCGRRYPIEDEIPILLAERAVIEGG